MAFPILGTPKPQFFDSSGSPLASGTLSVLEPADDTNKASYPTYDDAEAATNANANPITLDARGECDLWGLDGEDYKLVLKDSDANIIWTTDDVFVPLSSASSIGTKIYPQTATELAAGVTPTDYSYPEGHLYRYGDSSVLGNGTNDDTAAFQAMCNFAGYKYVPKPSSKYKVDEIDIIISNVLIYFEPGTIIEANTGYGLNDQVFDIGDPNDVSNIALIGNGSTIQMIKADYTSGEQRHCIRLTRATEIDISGFTLKDSGGDGLYIGSGDTYCENVYVKNCIMDNNRRQGCSITSGKNIKIDNCVFKNTTGTSPQCGIDIEWDADDIVTTEAKGTLDNIVISNCLSIDNASNGFQATAAHLTSPADGEFNVTFVNCTSISNSGSGFAFLAGKDGNRQNCTFDNCWSYDDSSNGFDLAHSGGDAKIIGGGVYNCNQASNPNNRNGSAVALYEVSTPDRDGDNYGNLWIDGLKVEDIDGNMNKVLTLQIVSETNSTIKDVYARIQADGIAANKRFFNTGANRSGAIDVEFTDAPVHDGTGAGITAANMTQYKNVRIQCDGGNFDLDDAQNQFLGDWFEFEITGTTTGTTAVIADNAGDVFNFYPYNAKYLRSKTPGSILRVAYNGTRWVVVSQTGIWEPEIQAFADQDATPSVAFGKVFKTANTVATTITDFDDGVEGQEIVVIINDTNTDIDFTASGLKGNVGADWTTATTGDHMVCVFDGTDWFCRISDNTA